MGACSPSSPLRPRGTWGRCTPTSRRSRCCWRSGRSWCSGSWSGCRRREDASGAQEARGPSPCRAPGQRASHSTPAACSLSSALPQHLGDEPLDLAADQRRSARSPRGRRARWCAARLDQGQRCRPPRRACRGWRSRRRRASVERPRLVLHDDDLVADELSGERRQAGGRPHLLDGHDVALDVTLPRTTRCRSSTSSRNVRSVEHRRHRLRARRRSVSFLVPGFGAHRAAARPVATSWPTGAGAGPAPSHAPTGE